MSTLNALVQKAEEGTAKKSSNKDDKSGQYMKDKTATIEFLVENSNEFATITDALIACPTTARKTLKKLLSKQSDAVQIEAILMHGHIDNKSIKKYVDEAAPELREQFTEELTIRYAEAAKLEI